MTIFRVLFRDLDDPTNSSDNFVTATNEAELRTAMRAADFFQWDAYHDEIPLAEWNDPKHDAAINTWADAVTADLLARGISDTSDAQTIWVLLRES